MVWQANYKRLVEKKKAQEEARKNVAAMLEAGGVDDFLSTVRELPIGARQTSATSFPRRAQDEPISEDEAVSDTEDEEDAESTGMLLAVEDSKRGSTHSGMTNWGSASTSPFDKSLVGKTPPTQGASASVPVALAGTATETSMDTLHADPEQPHASSVAGAGVGAGEPRRNPSEGLLSGKAPPGDEAVGASLAGPEFAILAALFLISFSEHATTASTYALALAVSAETSDADFGDGVQSGAPGTNTAFAFGTAALGTVVGVVAAGRYAQDHLKHSVLGALAAQMVAALLFCFATSYASLFVSHLLTGVARGYAVVLVSNWAQTTARGKQTPRTRLGVAAFFGGGLSAFVCSLVFAQVGEDTTLMEGVPLRQTGCMLLAAGGCFAGLIAAVLLVKPEAAAAARPPVSVAPDKAAWCVLAMMVLSQLAVGVLQYSIPVTLAGSDDQDRGYVKGAVQ